MFGFKRKKYNELLLLLSQCSCNVCMYCRRYMGNSDECGHLQVLFKLQEFARNVVAFRFFINLTLYTVTENSNPSLIPHQFPVTV